MEPALQKYSIPLFIASALFVVWAVLALMDFKNYTYLGHELDGLKVSQVDEGSPMEAAGLQVGDRLISWDGIAVENTKALNQQKRSVPGQTAVVVVERNGEQLELTPVYAPLPGKFLKGNYAVLAMVMVFLLFGVLALISIGTRAAFFFGLFAILLGGFLSRGPYFASEILRNIFNVLEIWLLLLSFVFLIKFLMNYPSSRNWASSRTGKWVIWGPAVVLGVFVSYLFLFMPDSTEGLRSMVNLLLPAILLFYFVWAIVLMMQNYLKASAEDRKKKGLGLMLMGVVLGFLPIVIGIAVNVIDATVVLPGDDFYILFFTLIPLSFFLALRRGTT